MNIDKIRVESNQNGSLSDSGGLDLRQFELHANLEQGEVSNDDNKLILKENELINKRKAERDDEWYFRNEWPKHEKHIFIMSSAGKPVYSRYGDEQKLCSFMPVLSTISSFVDETGDTIQTIVAGDHRIVFLFKGPLYFVAVSKVPEPAYHLVRQLEYVHAQMMSSLTAGVNKIYVSRAHFDIRSLLGDSTVYFDHLMDKMDNNMHYLSSFLLRGVCCLPMSSSIRNKIGAVLQSFQCDDLVYSLLLAKNQLVSLVRLKKHALHAEDFHVILNLISAPRDWRDNTATVPVCLPKFNDRGYLHAYVCFLCKDISLLLFSTKPGNFDHARKQIEGGLNDLNALWMISNQLLRGEHLYSVRDIEGIDLEDGLSRGRNSPGAQHRIVEKQYSNGDVSKNIRRELSKNSLSVGLQSWHSANSNPKRYPPKYLLHFLYKDQRTSQFTCPRYDVPYKDNAERKRIFSLYQRVHIKINSSRWPKRGGEDDLTKKKRKKKRKPHKVYYQISKRESILAWATGAFELYATFGPMVPKSAAIKSCNQVLRWIRSEESSLFILNTPVW